MEDTLLKMFNNTKTDLGNFGALTKQSYTTFDDSFNKVFENANKALSAEREYYKSSPEADFLKNKMNSSAQSPNQNEFRPDRFKENPNKINENRPDNNKQKYTSSEIVSEKSGTPEHKIDIKTEQKTEAKTESIKDAADKTKLSETALDKTSKDEVKAETKEDATKDVKIDVKADVKVDTKVEALPIQAPSAKMTEITQDLLNRIMPSATIIADDAVDSLTNTVKSTLTEAAKATLAETAKSSKDLKTDTTNLSQDLKTDLPKTTDTQASTEQVKTAPDKPKLQAQTQQILLNLKSDAPKTVESPVQLPTKPTEQAPLVKATTEAIAGAQVVNEANVKPTMKVVMERVALTQEMLDSAKAKVTSVELSTQSNNLLNQNAQEQGAKLAFEGNNNLLNPLDSGKTQGFAKTMDSLQQAPKELNKSDILAQMHNKMETLKEDGTTKVTIVLKPENLGKVNLELINSKDGLIARMTTENAQVKELLDKNLESLKNSLGAQGVNVNNVSVKVAETTNTPDEMYSFDDGGKQQKNQEQSDSKDENQTFEERFTNLKENSEETTITHDGEVDYKI